MIYSSQSQLLLAKTNGHQITSRNTLYQTSYSAYITAFCMQYMFVTPLGRQVLAALSTSMLRLRPASSEIKLTCFGYAGFTELFSWQ